MIIEILYKPGLMLLDLISFSYFIRPNVLIHNSFIFSGFKIRPYVLGTSCCLLQICQCVDILKFSILKLL